MSYTTMFVVAFVAFVGMASAVDVQVSAGNGQESATGFTSGYYSRFDPSVFEESMSFDFSGPEMHVSRSINMKTDSPSAFVRSVNATVTSVGDINHVVGVVTTVYETDTHYSQTYNSKTFEVL